MTESKLNALYFDWMCQRLCEYHSENYYKLLRYLHDTEFRYLLPMDGNRAEDGIDLRYRFGREHSYDNPLIASYLDICPCSVLEMMVALAIRCEEQIMDDPGIGDRTGYWFWSMIGSLGLDSMNDDNFDLDYVDDVISKFLDREYKCNGDGGLFTVKDCRKDLRSVEIWYQMCWFLNSIT